MNLLPRALRLSSCALLSLTILASPAKAFPSTPWRLPTTSTTMFTTLGSQTTVVSPVTTTTTTTTTARTTRGLSATSGGGRSSSDKQDTTEGFTREHHVELSTGVSMLVLSSLPNKDDTNKPTLLFLHGSFHGAWCWTEYFFPYFTHLGYPVVALSWRGTGGTPAGQGVKKVKIMEHVADLDSLLGQLESVIGGTAAAENASTAKRPPPVLIAHSFGSLAIMKYLEAYPERCQNISGVAILCGVPPSGNGRLTMRTLRRSLVDSWKITAGFAMKRCTKKADLCRDLFFGEPVYTREDGTVEDYGISDDDVARYQTYFARDSEATIDLLDLAKILPSAAAEDGVAPFAKQVPSTLVLGASRDFIVDEQGNQETAAYFGLDQPVMVDSPHDIMLGSQWRNAADALAKWLGELEMSSDQQ